MTDAARRRDCAHARRRAARLVRATGIVLVIVAVIHLVVTPLLAHTMSAPLSPSQWRSIGPPFLLDHVVVGVLMVPVGCTLVGLAPQLRAGARWAWWLLLVYAIAIASLPIALATIMPPELFQAPAFIVATILVTLVALVLPTVVIWAWPRRGSA